MAPRTGSDSTQKSMTLLWTDCALPAPSPGGWNPDLLHLVSPHLAMHSVLSCFTLLGGKAQQGILLRSVESELLFSAPSVKHWVSLWSRCRCYNRNLCCHSTVTCSSWQRSWRVERDRHPISVRDPEGWVRGAPHFPRQTESPQHFGNCVPTLSLVAVGQ